MKDDALALIGDLSDPSKKLNLLREYVQAQVLRSLHENEAFVNLSFVGGTALRFLFNLPRFSEDLDFSLDSEDAYTPTAWLKKVKSDLLFAGFDVSLTWNDRMTVHKAWIKIPGLLKEAGLAAMQSQNLSIKLEIDTRPPAGALSQRKVISRHALLAIKHHDLSSLMAGKLHALMTRKYAKGRDWYDLLWYMTQQPPVCPNLVQLQNALDQTQGVNRFAAESWNKPVLDAIKHIDVSALQADVQPFLEHASEASLLSVETFESLLS